MVATILTIKGQYMTHEQKTIQRILDIYNSGNRTVKLRRELATFRGRFGTQSAMEYVMVCSEKPCSIGSGSKSDMEKFAKKHNLVIV